MMQKINFSNFISKIEWRNRYMNDNGSICLVSVDGTDFRIFEQFPFDPKWYSHKFNGPGIRYEVGICIQTGWIVWVNGPYPCGEWPDIQIARDWLIYELDRGEKYLGDGGYFDGNQWSETPTGLNNEDQKMKAEARARHETVNGRFKQFGVLERRFRHKIHLHGKVFMAVANLVQAAIQGQHPTFQVDYYDNL
jgi:hypothetical protein